MILSYAYSGAGLVQQALADGTDLACTTATGILPLCEVAAASWAKIDDRPGCSACGVKAGSARVWVAAGALSDALDVVASVKSWPELPRITRWLVVASAGGAALAGAAGALVADAKPDRDSASS